MKDYQSDLRLTREDKASVGLHRLLERVAPGVQVFDFMRELEKIGIKLVLIEASK